jgi:hypothetical protein
VKVPKDDRNWQEYDVARVAQEEPNEFDDFGKSEHKDDLGPHCIPAARRIPILFAFHREMIINGSITNASDVNVAKCSVYIHQGCWRFRES